MKEPKVDLNRVVEACIRKLQTLQACKKQSEWPGSARKRRCWCCGQKGHLIRRFLSFKSVRLNTLGTGWYKYGLSLKSREVRNPRGLVSPGKASKDDKNSKEDSGRWSSSPGMIPGGRSRSFAAQFQGIPSWV